MSKIKTTLLISLLFFGLFFAFSPLVKAEVIRNFSTTINVLPDSSILVTEKINYDFEDVIRHGITRTIPLVNSKNKPIKIEVVSITDENGNPSKYTTSKTNGSFTIKIGDPDRMISSLKEYNISYHVFGGIAYYDDFDEIYWNATGNEWQVSILKSEAKVILPNNIFPLKQACYYGKSGSTVNCKISESNTFSPDVSLGEKEGLTIAVSFPKGAVAVYKVNEESAVSGYIKTFWPVVIPILVFIFMFLRWLKKGRDPKGTGVIIAQYDVLDNLTPLEVGGIINDEIKNENISAEIIYLATKGFIKIKQIDPDCDNYLCLIKNKDYEFTLLKKEGILVNSFDKIIIRAIFGENGDVGGVSLLSTLNNSFYKSIKDINNYAINSLLNKKYYLNLPKIKLHFSFILVGLWLVFIFNGFMGVLGGNDSRSIIFKIILSASIILSTIIFIVFNRLMPAKSKKGVLAKEHLLGLKEYLQIAERDRLNFHNAPDKKPEIFENLLPFAMVFGVEELWAKEFENVFVNQPNWYEGSNNFNVVKFGNDIAVFSKLTSSSLSSSSNSSGAGSSGSGGGGSSGGGGGGGGGGSW
jgi:uncharacterized membrane protein YgcG